ncbi:Uncharacterized protein TPAR_06020 [Tolypocladium paradoxum]|uniref:HTH CENPB-type domain-containing protein n=1 Tax=Tolypocladium paradoxum TaxID=94208 RepID=A0A2S4KUC1_9HYPO|nr:Uncharacterized protein TPAR_06020 [Tolypocladium paradoxum]
MPRHIKYTEETLQQAIAAVKNGISQRKACLQWGILRQTLQYRIYGAIPRSAAQEPNQRLTRLQETHLRDWVLAQGALGLPPSHFQLKEFASRILITSGDHRPLGKNWVTGFLRRNPECIYNSD